MLISRLATCVAALALGAVADVASADTAAGKRRFDAICGECHDSADFEGENPAALAGTLRKMVAGDMAHKKTLRLSDQEIVEVANYMSTGGK